MGIGGWKVGSKFVDSTAFEHDDLMGSPEHSRFFPVVIFHCLLVPSNVLG